MLPLRTFNVFFFAYFTSISLDSVDPRWVPYMMCNVNHVFVTNSSGKHACQYMFGKAQHSSPIHLGMYTL